MKKRLLAMLLCAVVGLTATGCNGTESSAVNSAADTTTATTTTAEQTTTTTPETTAVTDETTTSATESSAETTVPTNTGGTALDFASNLMPGWNLGNTLDSISGSTSSETAWGNPKVTKEMFQAVKDAGFKSVRIPVSYVGQFDESYNIDSAWMSRVKEVVDMAVDCGLYVIVNIHHDGSTGINGKWLDVTAADQTKVQAQFKKAWEQISSTFKDYDEKLVFESMNEAMEDGNYGVPAESTYTNINNLNQLFVDTVRASGGNNAQRYLLMPGYNTNIDQTTEGSGFALPKDSATEKLMVSVHYYDPYDFALNESKDVIFRWGSSIKGQRASWGNEDYVVEQFTKLKTTFIDKGIPVVIGEYGAIDKSSKDERNTIYRGYYCEYLNKTAAEMGITTVYWDNGYAGNHGFALFDRKTFKQLYPTIISSIVKGATEDYTIVAPTD